ncbi:MAG: 30S ribosomal protein S6 [bacterium]|nr:30S ribosomal protein S6 [bacterium]
MKSYELTYIISSQMMSQEADAFMKEVETFVQSKDGVVLKSEKTIAQPLAYRIKKQSSGYFAILTFQAAEDKIKEILEKLNKDTQILRSTIMVKKPIKEMKERRTRKPAFTQDKEAAAKAGIFKEEKKEEKLNPEDLNKKIDEILGE